MVLHLNRLHVNTPDFMIFMRNYYGVNRENGIYLIRYRLWKVGR